MRSAKKVGLINRKTGIVRHQHLEPLARVGPVDTDMNPAEGEFVDALIPLIAVGRYGKAEEIASFVAYLVGPEAGYITGASLTIDGGFGA